MHPTYKRLMQHARDHRNMSGPAEVGRFIGESEQTMSNWKLRGVPKAKHVDISIKLGCDPAWLANGGQSSEANVSPARDIRGSVPIISSVQAGDFREVIDHLHPGEGDRIDVTVPVRAHTFALRVEGDSMEPEFPEGIVVVVEPEMTPLPGQFVIAKNGDAATLKQLIRDGEDYYLKPVNPRYPIKPLGNCRIIGVVREAIRRYA